MGHGHVIKLINNHLPFVAMTCTSEAVSIGEQVGSEVETMLDVFNQSSAQNTATSFKLPGCIMTEEYGMDYSMVLVEKNMQMLMDVARKTSTPFMISGIIRRLIAYIRSKLGQGTDYTEI